MNNKRLISVDSLLSECENSAWGIDIMELKSILEYVPAIDAIDAIEKLEDEVYQLKEQRDYMGEQLDDFSAFLCDMTGGRFSETNYSARDMITYANDYQQELCDKCDVKVENARLRTERDAAMKDLAKVSVCGTCVHYAPHSKGKCSKHRHKIVDSNFAGCTCWQWRGVRGVEE